LAQLVEAGKIVEDIKAFKNLKKESTTQHDRLKDIKKNGP
jgi:hypothetical protein